MRIFRNARKNGILSKNLLPYFGYALGEIALVIIGILIGLSLNKWNEQRKLVNILNSEIQLVAEDLRQDTSEINTLLELYEEMREPVSQAIAGTMSDDQLDSCFICLSFIAAYRPLLINQRGYNQIEKYSDHAELKQDSLLSDINSFYSAFLEINGLNKELLFENMQRNIIHWQGEYEWFAEVLSQGPVNDAFIDYVKTDQEYRNLVAYQSVLIYENFIPLLETYKSNGTELLISIENRLKKVN